LNEGFVVQYLPGRALAEGRCRRVDRAGQAAIDGQSRAADQVDRDAGIVGRDLDQAARLPIGAKIDGPVKRQDADLA
jgi:hypothetical protein